MKFDPDICRSLLFVPAGNRRFLDSALRGAADVIQLDLEDAIAPAHKNQARASAAAAIGTLHAAGRVAAVRVNADDDRLQQDLQAVVVTGLAAVTVPKVENAHTLQAIDAAIGALEADRGLVPGEVRLIAQIESATGVLNAREIAVATPRLAAMGIGMEDLIADVGGAVAADALYFPAMQTLYAARAAGVAPIGYLGSITVYQDQALFREWISRAKQLGFDGGFCIHPNQVDILNDTLQPSADEAAAAQALIRACEAHGGVQAGAFAYRGRMVDAPVIERARRTLRRCAAFARGKPEAH